MTIKELINYNIGVEELDIVEDILKRVLDIDENITVKSLLEIIEEPIEE